MGVKSRADCPSEHSELVAELSAIEKMTTADRLKHAKKRRSQQLKKFSLYEKGLDKEIQKNKKKPQKVQKPQKSRRIVFPTNVMLLEAAARNDVDEVKRLLEDGVSPDVTNEDGLTALHQCCIDDLENMMSLLLAHGADVNARDTELWTPLHAAATCGHVHLCQYLIDHGAELLSVNADGNMPYDICEDEVTLDYIESEMAKRGVTQEMIDETRLSTENKMLEDLQSMANNNKDLEYTGRSGETPLHIAAANGYIQVVEFLLEHRVRVDAVDDDSWQPVHCAACWGHLPVLELLIQHGADLEAKTKNGETPMDICEDLDLKDRLTELKDELESSRGDRAPSLTRRRSANTRSASVRRTSMREKSKISWKEAQEEAQRLREGSTDEVLEDEDEEDAAAADLRNDVSKLQQDMQEILSKDEQATRGAAAVSTTTTSVDQVHLQMQGSEETKHSQPHSSGLWGSAAVVPVPKKETAKKEPPKKEDQKKEAPKKETTKVETVKKEAPKKDKPSPKTVKKDTTPKSSPKVGKAAVVMKDTTPKSSPKVSRVGKVAEVKRDTTPKSSPKLGKAAAPRAPTEKQKQVLREQQQAATPAKQQPRVADPHTQPHHVASVAQSPASSASSSTVSPADKKSLTDRRLAQDDTNHQQPPHGTLADLKKQRAKKLADTMKSKDMSLPNSPVQNNYPPPDVVGNDTAVSQQNGHKKDVQQQQQSQNRNMYGGGSERRKYSSTSEIVGNPQSDSNCCVIL